MRSLYRRSDFVSVSSLICVHACVHLFPAFRCILDLDELKKLQMDRRNVCNSDFYMRPAFSQLLIMKLTKTHQSLPRFTFFRMALPTMILMMLAVFKRVIGWKVSFVLDHTLWFDRKFSQLMLFEFWQNWGYHWLVDLAFPCTLQMFAGIYRDFAGKLECGDF